MRRLALALWGLGLGCGADTLGVQTITFPFTPMPAPELPMGIDGSLLEQAKGTCTVDVATGRGVIRVTGLPTLPAGFSYTVMVHVTPDPRTWIPEPGGTATVGHVHGALTGTSAATVPNAHEGHETPPSQSALFVQPLAPSTTAPGSLETAFGGADLAPLPLAGVRGGMIILHSTDTSISSVLLMLGDVTMNPTSGAASTSASGHVHGA